LATMVAFRSAIGRYACHSVKSRYPFWGKALALSRSERQQWRIMVAFRSAKGRYACHSVKTRYPFCGKALALSRSERQQWKTLLAWPQQPAIQAANPESLAAHIPGIRIEQRFTHSTRSKAQLLPGPIRRKVPVVSVHPSVGQTRVRLFATQSATQFIECRPDREHE